MSSLLPALAEATMLPAGIDPEYLAPADVRESLEPIRHSVSIVKGNGQRGAFFRDGTELGSTLTGCMLHLFLPQTWFAARAGSPLAASERQYQWPTDRPICSSADFRRPPRVNSRLDDRQREEVSRRRAGVACGSCPVGAWSDSPDGGRRLAPQCEQSRRLLFCSHELGPEPVWLALRGWSSVKSLDRFLDAHFRFGRTAISLYSYEVALGWESAVSAKGDYYRLVLSLGQQMPREHLAALEAIRLSYTSTADDVEETADPPPAPAQSSWIQPEEGELEDIPF